MLILTRVPNKIKVYLFINKQPKQINNYICIVGLDKIHQFIRRDSVLEGALTAVNSPSKQYKLRIVKTICQALYAGT